ncbi:MAG TPA: NAD(P)H-binding protein, partial [Steroidobacteraceae bacterium]|nr:NAD(P)H-binding protein [Steroidobacteraceae bacterium]
MRTVSSALVTLLSVVIMAANAEQPVEQTAATTLVVAGASGRTGRLVVEQAMQQGFVVRALTRDPERAARIAPDYHWSRADVR